MIDVWIYDDEAKVFFFLIDKMVLRKKEKIWMTCWMFQRSKQKCYEVVKPSVS